MKYQDLPPGYLHPGQPELLPARSSSDEIPASALQRTTSLGMEGLRLGSPYRGSLPPPLPAMSTTQAGTAQE